MARRTRVAGSPFSCLFGKANEVRSEIREAYLIDDSEIENSKATLVDGLDCSCEKNSVFIYIVRKGS